MPSSRASTIPYVIHIIKQLQPMSILDVGVGFGKWGYLFREYTDIIHSEHDPGRYVKSGWRVRLEGIEGYQQYLHAAHEYIYDQIHVGRVQEILPRLGSYDIIFFGDIIEHLVLAEGRTILREALSHAKKAVIVTTPRYDTRQGKLCDNDLEAHQSVWSTEDFKRLGECKTVLADKDTVVVVFSCSEKARSVKLTWERPQARSWCYELLRRIASAAFRRLRSLPGHRLGSMSQ